MKDKTTAFKYVDYLWDESQTAKMAGDEVALFLYRSNILGADLRITNFGGGNTSCRTIEKDPLTGDDKEIMWIKGSGGDLGTLTRKGISALYLDRMLAMENIYNGADQEDDMVAMLSHCVFDPEGTAPSIDTPLHGFLPFKHIDHLHPDALIAIAAAKDSKKITRELWGDKMGWIPWQRPGFDLGLKLRNYLAKNPGIRGIVLGGHGVFTWGDTSFECYVNSLEVIETASKYLEAKIKKNGQVFGGVNDDVVIDDQEFRRIQASLISPILRGQCSENRWMVGHFTDNERVLEFINSNDLQKLAPMGTSCPDHFLRTKIRPMVVNMHPNDDLEDYEKVAKKLNKQFGAYRKAYKAYYDKFKLKDSPAMRDANPVVILYPGIGMFTYAKDKKTARIASEFYINAINVMRGAEAVSKYVALPQQEAFNIEYWALEEAKLQRQPAEKPLTGRIAFITGGGGGIGKAIAHKLVDKGACVIMSDINDKWLHEAEEEFGKDSASGVVGDVYDENRVAKSIEKSILDFGGVDILIHSAGLAISKPLVETTMDDWELLMDVLSSGQFNLAREGVQIMRKQKLGGDIVNIVSKNALVAGPNNIGYGTAKAAQLHMSRLLAAELGKEQIRVNVVNPDAVITGSKIWEGDWAEGRAKAYGISIDELPAHYAKRNLLNAIIGPEDIANAVCVFLTDLTKSTGNILNVDGGITEAFVR